MAGKTRKSPARFTVEKIKAGLIIHRLENHILTYPGKRDYDKHLMTQAQVTAALGLIKKVHPDLAAATVDVSGDVTIEVLQVASHKATK